MKSLGQQLPRLISTLNNSRFVNDNTLADHQCPSPHADESVENINNVCNRLTYIVIAENLPSTALTSLCRFVKQGCDIKVEFRQKNNLIQLVNSKQLTKMKSNELFPDFMLNGPG
jgi:hypothetical protein